MAITVSTHWTVREPEIKEQPLSLRAEVLGCLAAHCELKAAKSDGEEKQNFLQYAAEFRDRQLKVMGGGHAS